MAAQNAMAVDWSTAVATLGLRRSRPPLVDLRPGIHATSALRHERQTRGAYDAAKQLQVERYTPQPAAVSAL
jgi:hypothetical protein